MHQRERVVPGPGQESVWDYPRPPALEPVRVPLRVVFEGKTIANTAAGYRMLETSHPPVYYLPPQDVDMTSLVADARQTFCEFKGRARYWSLQVDGIRSEGAAWSYPSPTARFDAIAHYLAFYATAVDECWVGDERVTPQAGDFYGGWITSTIVGPFKGAPGTWGW